MVRNRVNKVIMKSIAMASILTMMAPSIVTASRFTESVTSRDPSSSSGTKSNKDRIVVLDPGHGKSSSAMSDSEKTAEGFVKNGGSWGEWRHWKNNDYGTSCEGAGCSNNNPSENNPHWYSMGKGDRSTEPEVNLNNANAAKKYLEEMGYTVRITRTSNNDNPSFTKRASYCFPNNDTSQSPDAELYVCVHSNAGGGRGTSYIAAEGSYTQKYIPSDYATRCNTAGDIINKKVAAASGLKENGPIGNEGYLIAFNKNPVTTAYLEIGFYDNSSDLSILQSKSDEIGKAIADGVNEYLQTVEPSVNTGGNGSGTNVKLDTTITSNERKFLGLWKNETGRYQPYYNSDGTVNEKALFNSDGKYVKYRLPRSSQFTTPGTTILTDTDSLFELLSLGERTQIHEQIMRYLMYVYTGKDYGVTSFDFSIFDLENFNSMGNAMGDIPLYTPTVTREDFIKAMEEFSASGPKSLKTNFDSHFLSRAGDIYDWGVQYGVNPELVVVFAWAEQGFRDPVGDESNFWGLATPNGTSSKSLGSFENGEKTMAEFFQNYNAGAGTWQEEEILKYYNERQGYNPNGYGMPGTLKGALSIYTDLLPNNYPHIEGDTGGLGGRAYLREIYGDEYAAKCGNVHSLGDAWTVEEEADASAHVYEGRKKMWETIFGKYATLIGGGSFLQTVGAIQQYLKENNYGYCLFGGEKDRSHGGLGGPHGIESTFEESKSGLHLLCCATLVSWSLYECGYTEFKDVNGCSVLDPMLRALGAEEITEYSQLQPGDICFRGEAHVQVYAGNGTWYNAGSNGSIRRDSPYSSIMSGFTHALRLPQK